jgi:hypothetical protein
LIQRTADDQLWFLLSALAQVWCQQAPDAPVLIQRTADDQLWCEKSVDAWLWLQQSAVAQVGFH